jgi:hypothetical protein
MELQWQFCSSQDITIFFFFLIKKNFIENLRDYTTKPIKTLQRGWQETLQRR